MSGRIIHFDPRAGASAERNVADFVALCRDSTILRAKEQFELNTWEPGYTLKGKNAQQRIIFSTLVAASENAREPSMAEPFLSFAKCALVYLQGVRAIVSQAVRLAALRCIEFALSEQGTDISVTAVRPIILDAAVDEATRRFGAEAAYRIAGQIRIIAELIREKRFAYLPIRWEHGLKKPRELGSRISKESMAARERRLPSAAAIRAIGGIYQIATRTNDVIIINALAIMLCAPERVNELLRLQRNCIVQGDGRFSDKVGIRWQGSKGADNTVKWLPSEMASIAKESLDRLHACTHAGHRIASWYVRHPNEIFLHEGAAHLRGRQHVSFSEIALLLWGERGSVRSAKAWCKRQKITPLFANGIECVCFREVELAVLRYLPAAFPFLPGTSTESCENALMVVRRYEMSDDRLPYECMFALIDINSINDRLDGGERRGVRSIFSSYDFTEDNGSPIKITTHMFRHWLNMLAQMGGLSDAEIAAFSGRRDVRQNRAYDHMSSEEVQAPIALAMKEFGFTRELAVHVPRTLVSRGNFSDIIGDRAAHTTLFGYCVHDFASEPCQMYRDCLNCQEQICVKGEAHKLENLRHVREEMEVSLTNARHAMSEGDYGADLWVRQQEQSLERVKMLIGYLSNPEVPDGARIRVAPNSVPALLEPGAARIGSVLL